jgi:hypothetical protein
MNVGDFFTWTVPSWTPANGDIVIFNDSTVAAGLTLGVTYYSVNVSGNDFQLATSLGGSPVAVLSDGSCSAVLCCIRVANPPATGFQGSFVYDAGYAANVNGYVNWMLALGITTSGLSTVSSELETRLAGVDYRVNPKFVMQTTY